MKFSKDILLKRFFLFLVIAFLLIWLDVSRTKDEYEGLIKIKTNINKVNEKINTEVADVLYAFSKAQTEAVIKFDNSKEKVELGININQGVENITKFLNNLVLLFNKKFANKYKIEMAINEKIEFSKKEYELSLNFINLKTETKKVIDTKIDISDLKENIKEGREVVVFWHAMGGHMEEALVEIINEFNNMQKEIYVQHINMGNYGTLQQKLLGSVFAKQTPDIAQMFEALTLQFIDGDKIVSLEDFVNHPEYGIDKKDIIKVFLENNTFYNEIWSLPFNKSVPILYYNKDLLKQAGFDPNTPPKTWEEFINYCKKLTIDKDNDGIIDQYGVGFKLEDAWGLLTYMISAGGKVINDAQNEVYFNSEAGIDTVKFLADLLAKHKAAYTATGFNHQNDFTVGKTAFFWGSVVSVNFLKGKYDFELGMTHLPYEKTPASIISGTNVSIFKSNPKKELASWKFLRFLTNTINSAKWAIATNYLPIRYSTLESSIFKEAIKKDPKILGSVSQLDYASFEPRHPKWYTARMDFQKAMETALRPFDSYSKDYINSKGKLEKEMPSYDHIQEILDESVKKINRYLKED